jgi:hypothetical protein
MQDASTHKLKKSDIRLAETFARMVLSRIYWEINAHWQQSLDFPATYEIGYNHFLPIASWTTEARQ